MRPAVDVVVVLDAAVAGVDASAEGVAAEDHEHRGIAGAQDLLHPGPLLDPQLGLAGQVRAPGRIAVAAAVQRQAVHVAGADVEVAAPLGVGRDLVPQLPRPRQQRRSVGVVVGAVLVVVHDEPDRDALPQGDESGVGQEPLKAVGEELGRAAVAGVVEVAGVAEVALEDHRRRRPGGRLQQPLVALVAHRSDQLVTAGAEQREAVSVPGQRDVVQRGDRLRRARQRPQTHAPADVAIGADPVERGQREAVDDLFRALVEPTAGHRPLEPDAGRVGAPHAHAHVVAAVEARAGDARDQHRRDRAGRLRLSVRGDGVAVHLQPARPQAEGVHGQDAGIPCRGRHRSRYLPVSLGLVGRPRPRPDAAALVADVQHVSRARGRRVGVSGGNGAAAVEGVLRDHQRSAFDGHPHERVGAGRPQQQPRPQAGVRDAELEPLGPVCVHRVQQLHGHRLVGGGGVHAGRHRQHRRSGVDQQRPLERYPARPPSVGPAERAADAKPARRRPRRRRHRVPAAAEQLSGGDACRGGAGQRQQTGPRVAPPGHRSGSLVQRYPGTSSGRGASAPAPAAANTETGPTWARRLSPGSRISRFA